MLPPTWIDEHGLLLSQQAPLPLDQPITRGMANAHGVSDRQLSTLIERGFVRKVLRGVYAATQAPDDVRMRAQALGLVVPECAVITDRTAAWLHGVPILKRGAHLSAPPIDCCETADSRVRRPGVDGRRRGLRRSDTTVVHGVRVTTLTRTALDLGRLLWRFDALASIDGALRLGADHERLLAESLRFRGYRGVRQLRALLPLGDGRAESAGESALRLHWYDAGLPAPVLQHWITGDDGDERFRLDLSEPDLRYAAEYDGEQFHTHVKDVSYDRSRREWIRNERHWTIDVFDKQDVYGMDTNICDRLAAGIARARRTYRIWSP